MSLLGPSAVEVWGAARPSGGTARPCRCSRSLGKGAYNNLGGPISVTNMRGYFRARFRIAKAAKRDLHVHLGGLTSRATKAAVR